MRIELTSVFVDDQAAALEFYTQTLGFSKRHDVPVGEFLWLTVVAPDRPDGPELLLEPSNHPAVGPYRSALKADGIPAAQFSVDDVETEYQRLTAAGVEFTLPISRYRTDTSFLSIPTFDRPRRVPVQEL